MLQLREVNGGFLLAQPQDSGNLAQIPGCSRTLRFRFKLSGATQAHRRVLIG